MALRPIREVEMGIFSCRLALLAGLGLEGSRDDFVFRRSSTNAGIIRACRLLQQGNNSEACNKRKVLLSRHLAVSEGLVAHPVNYLFHALFTVYHPQPPYVSNRKYLKIYSIILKYYLVYTIKGSGVAVTPP